MTITMHTNRNVTITAALISLLSACSGSDSSSNTLTEVQLPEPIRQIAAIRYTDLFADILVDETEPQTFQLSTSESVVVHLSDIVPGMSHDIQIEWYEITDGVRLNLATQSGSFLATQGSTFSVPYVTAGFDADNDGISNFRERVNDTCPWIQCASDGRSLLNPLVALVVNMAPVGNLVQSFTRGADDQWQESGTTDNLTFNWSAASYSRTSIHLQDNERCIVCDPFQPYLLEINLANGTVIFDYNDGEQEPFLLYEIENVETGV